MKRPALIVALLLSVVASVLSVGQTNYYCIVCGKGPLTGRIWLHPRGPICDDCEKLPDHCSICGLPVRPGDGHIQTPDGRFICRFDKTNVVLTVDQARDLFAQTRQQVVDIYGPQFALKYPQVTVNLFDVDYWSEHGQANGLHKFGFASTRKSSDGACTHEVIMLSGRTRDEMTAVAAHEYTHLWINENCPPDHHIDGDTVEAICELTAYKLMQELGNDAMQKRILENPYTRGRIQDAVAAEREGGTDYILNWVKHSQAPTFDENGSLAPFPKTTTAMPFVAKPSPPPRGLTFSGIMQFGKERLAVINEQEFAPGDQKTLKLSQHSVSVRCVKIQENDTLVEVGGREFALPRGKEEILP